ncbi:MAG: DUF975 family protein [Elusimicrobiota bacterium]|nr:DUF975 family protein [Elusimicrobiota bacterium]
MISMTENKILMAQARQTLDGRWGVAIGTYLVFMLITIGVQFIPEIGKVISFFIGGPMTLGLAIFSLSLSRKQKADLPQLFEGFKKFWIAFGTYILMGIFIFLWALLLLIPGIIAALSYSQTFYIISENDSISPLDAITKSKEIMRGNKWKFFLLGLRFFGWILLSILTLGIGFLWIGPYMMISFAKFYDDVKEKEPKEETLNNENTVAV